MKRKMLWKFVFAVFAVAFTTTVTVSQPRASDDELLPTVFRAYDDGLFSAELLNTGPYVCDNVQHTKTWTNKSKKTIYIRSAQIWAGVDLGAKVDIMANLKRLSDKTQLLWYGQDAYAPGRSPHQWNKDFAPDYVPLAPGDGLVMLYWCAGEGHGHHVIDIWYLESKP